MKRIVIAAGLVSFVALSGSASAQNTVKLLEPVSITSGGPAVPFDEAVAFASKQLYLQCNAGATAQIEGPFPGASLIVDNYIQVQSPDSSIRNYCPDLETYGCFTVNADPGGYIGQPAESAYGPVGPQDVSASLVKGSGPLHVQSPGLRLHVRLVGAEPHDDVRRQGQGLPLRQRQERAQDADAWRGGDARASEQSRRRLSRCVHRRKINHIQL